MKLRFAYNRRVRKRELVVLLGRGETTSSRRLRWLETHAHTNLAPFWLEERGKRRKTRLHYDIDGFTSVHGYVRHNEISIKELTTMLVSLARTLAWCSSDCGRYLSLLLDPAYVFVGMTGELHMVFLPVEGAWSLLDDTPLTFLASLAQDVRTSTPAATDLVRQLRIFVQEQGGAFSLNALRAFLREQCNIIITARGDVGVGGGTPVPKAAPTGGFLVRRTATGEVFELKEGKTVVGRGSGCDLRVDGNSRISRQHACIELSGQLASLCDMGSTNGTYLEGRRLAPHSCVPLRPGQIFILDDEQFVLV